MICDRYYYSILAYHGMVGQLSQGYVRKILSLSSDNTSPDVPIFLDIVPELSLGRKEEKDRVESRPIEYHNKVRNSFISLARKIPKASIIDASKSISEIQNEIWKIVYAALSKKSYNP